MKIITQLDSSPFHVYVGLRLAIDTLLTDQESVAVNISVNGEPVATDLLVTATLPEVRNWPKEPISDDAQLFEIGLLFDTSIVKDTRENHAAFIKRPSTEEFPIEIKVVPTDETGIVVLVRADVTIKTNAVGLDLNNKVKYETLTSPVEELRISEPVEITKDTPWVAILTSDNVDSLVAGPVSTQLTK